MTTLLVRAPRSTIAARATGTAGIGYAVGAGVENMNVLQSPGLGSPAAAIRAAYSGGEAVVAIAAGSLALVAFAAFAVGLYRYRSPGAVGPAAPDRRPVAVPARVGLVCGLLGAASAAVGLMTNGVLWLRIDGLPDDAVVALFSVHPRLQVLAGPFVGVFLLAATGTDALPAWLGAPGRVVGAALTLAPTALLVGGGAAVTVGFALFTVWVFVAGVWLAVAGPFPAAVLLRRALFLVLVVAAGLVGVVLLAAPHATATFFSWGLAPRPLAAFAGGVYLGSAAVYALAGRRPWPEVHGLVAGAAVLAVSVLGVTFVHLDRFDPGRLQAWAWVVLFGLFAVLTVGLLGTTGPPAAGPRAAWPFVAVATVLGVLTAVLWISPALASAFGPFPMPALGARFAGCWTALLAALAAVAARRVATARFAAVALVALPAGALLGALRTVDELRAPLAYAATLAATMVIGLLVLAYCCDGERDAAS